VDCELGACFFGVPADRISAVRQAFGVPEEQLSVGVISVGYPRPEATVGSAALLPRRPRDVRVHEGRWSA
jgi:nitroreductase